MSEAPSTESVDGGAPVTMANTKAEIVDAALMADLVYDSATAEAMTKTELLALWE